MDGLEHQSRRLDGQVATTHPFIHPSINPTLRPVGAQSGQTLLPPPPPSGSCSCAQGRGGWGITQTWHRALTDGCSFRCHLYISPYSLIIPALTLWLNPPDEGAPPRPLHKALFQSTSQLFDLVFSGGEVMDVSFWRECNEPAGYALSPRWHCEAWLQWQLIVSAPKIPRWALAQLWVDVVVFCQINNKVGATLSGIWYVG